jgi:hypothetical protein
LGTSFDSRCEGLDPGAQVFVKKTMSKRCHRGCIVDLAFGLGLIPVDIK